MFNFIQRILFKLEVFFNTKKFKVATMYENKKYNTYVMITEEDKLLNIFINGLIFKIPLNMPIQNDKQFLEAKDKIEEANLDSSSLEDLKSLLKHYEEEENFEKCSYIKDIIKKKLNEKTY